MTANAEGIDERRLWIGNLDTRISEYQLLKILQKYGHIEKFDLLFHRSGPLTGQPRGYAFVTYGNINETTLALEKLNGKLIGSRNIAVRFAKNINYDELEKPKPKLEIPALAAGAGTVDAQAKISKEVTIQAIEAKLKLLEKKSDGDDFQINKTVAEEIPIIQKYQFNKNQEKSSKSQSVKIFTKNRHKMGPYNKHGKR